MLSNCAAAAAAEAAINLCKEDTHIKVGAVHNKEVAKLGINYQCKTIAAVLYGMDNNQTNCSGKIIENTPIAFVFEKMQQ